MKKPFLVISLVAILAVGVPAAVWIWETARPEQVGEARSNVQGATSPFVRSAAWLARKAANGLEYIVTAGQVRRERNLLQQENGRLKVENAALRETLRRYERLDAAARLAETRNWRVIQADAVAYGPSRWPYGIVINRGTDDGVALGDPVLHLTGLVGVVMQTARHTATIQTLASPQSAVGVIVLPTRARGVVRGRGRTDVIEIELEDPEMPLQPGQQVISSGARGSLYPAGLDVGTVGDLRTNRFGQMVADVNPSTAFSRVEEVLVLKATPSRRSETPRAAPPPGVRAPAVGTEDDTGSTSATEARQ